MINYVTNYKKTSSKISCMKKNEIDNEFYTNCLVYFDALRKSGRSDDIFRDEYFFTLPAISNSN